MSVSYEIYYRERDRAERLELESQQLRRQLDSRNETHEDLRSRISSLEEELSQLKATIAGSKTMSYDLDCEIWDGPEGLGRRLIDALPDKIRKGKIALFILDGGNA